MSNWISRIALVYLGVSIAWIGSCDTALSQQFPGLLPLMGPAKGWVFAILSAVVLNWVLIRDCRRRDAVERDLRTLAIYDPLTGLLNRTAFLADLDKAMARAKRETAKVGVIFVDLDGFKAINDDLGHHIGDAMLVEVARRLKGVTRSSDSAVRYGGDEFVLLVVGDKSDGTERLAQRVLEALSQPVRIQGMDIAITASVGFAVYPDHGGEGDQLVRSADKAMYRVKAMGKNAILGAIAA